MKLDRETMRLWTLALAFGMIAPPLHGQDFGAEIQGGAVIVCAPSRVGIHRGGRRDCPGARGPPAVRYERLCQHGPLHVRLPKHALGALIGLRLF